MNKDQVSGAVKDIAGKIQQQTGKLLDSKEQETQGLLRQADGKAQKEVGNIKEFLTDIKKL